MGINAFLRDWGLYGFLGMGVGRESKYGGRERESIHEGFGGLGRGWAWWGFSNFFFSFFLCFLPR